MLTANPDDILRNHDYAVMCVDENQRFRYLAEVYYDRDDAERDCALMNASSAGDNFVVVAIEHSSGATTVEYDGNDSADRDRDFAIAKLADEHDVAFAALHHVFRLLEDGDLTKKQILWHTRGFCDSEGLANFA